MLLDVLRQLEPLILEVVAIGLSILIAWLGAKANKFLGVKIEEKHMAALHSAAMNGVRRALHSGVPPERMLGEAVRYVKESVPDAVGALVREEGVLWRLVEAKKDELLRQAGARRE